MRSQKFLLPGPEGHDFVFVSRRPLLLQAIDLALHGRAVAVESPCFECSDAIGRVCRWRWTAGRFPRPGRPPPWLDAPKASLVKPRRVFPAGIGPVCRIASSRQPAQIFIVELRQGLHCLGRIDAEAPRSAPFPPFYLPQRRQLTLLDRRLPLHGRLANLGADHLFGNTRLVRQSIGETVARWRRPGSVQRLSASGRETPAGCRPSLKSCSAAVRSSR